MIFKYFIKNSEQTDNPEVRNAYGKFAGIFGILTNALLFAVKIILGLLSSSISIIADAINNLSDAGSSLITLFSFKIAGKPADAEHPYGHARMEYISGLIVSCIITAIGFDLFTSSFGRIITPAETHHTTLGIVILFISGLLKLLQSAVYRAAGKKINSPSLIASATDSRNDVVSTLVVILGSAVEIFAKINVDGWFGCAVALFVIYSGIRLILEMTDHLIGNAPSAEAVKALSDKILSYDGIIGIHDLMMHDYGFGRGFASVHAEVDASIDVLISHDLIDNIEYDVLNTMNITLVIHLDPVETNNEELNELRQKVNAIIKEINPSLSMHDFRRVKGPTHSNLIFDVAMPLDCQMDDKTLCQKITAKTREIDPTFNTVITVDRIYMNSRIKNEENK